MQKVLLLDIESAPNKGYFWELFEPRISTDQVESTGYVLCWSAQWLGKSEILFDSVKRSGMKAMLKRMWDLIDEADIVIHYNGLKYDIPVLNREFVKKGMPPPAPPANVDLYRVVRSAFKFQSNKLDFVCRELGLGGKVKHEGFLLWVDCMDPARPGHKAAWVKMEKYNRHDVRLLKKLYLRLRPWIRNHPNVGAGMGVVCPKCASSKRRSLGRKYLASGIFRRYRCECGAVYRDSRRLEPLPGGRGVNL